MILEWSLAINNRAYWSFVLRPKTLEVSMYLFHSDERAKSQICCKTDILNDDNPKYSGDQPSLHMMMSAFCNTKMAPKLS